MGLRTASVRRPHVMVMAPALTDSNQSQNFKLPTDEHPQPTSAFNSAADQEDDKTDEHLINGKDLNAFDNLNTLALATELLGDFSRASDKHIKGSALTPLHLNMSGSALPMGERNEKMGLQKKDKGTNNEVVDQIFGENVDEIIQVIKSIEGGNLPAEADMFALSSTDLEKELFTDVDMMNIGMEEHLIEGAVKDTETKDQLSELKKRQAKIERRLDFLIRRTRKLQARCMGQHASSEIAGIFEHVYRTLRKLKDTTATPQDPPPPENSPPEKQKPLSTGSIKSLVRKLEMSTILQANAASRQRHSGRYFGSGSLEPGALRGSGAGSTTTILPPWSSGNKQELQRVVGLLESELGVVQSQVDSEATASSSGGESADEMQNFNNPLQQPLCIQKRAIWRYLTERAAIAARWTWLQAQISDLEYRIRQHTDLHRQVRSAKGHVELDACCNVPAAQTSPATNVPMSPSAVNGYRGQLPGATHLATTKNADGAVNGALLDGCMDHQCARTRPLVNFRKRKLMQTTGLHAVSKKAARPSTIRCGCIQPNIPCAVCTGRTDPTHPRDLVDSASKMERIALLDPCFHPVFSLPEDVSAGLHFEAIMKMADWQQRSSRSSVKTMKIMTKAERYDKTNLALDHRSKKLEHRKKYNRLLKPDMKKIRGRKSSRHHSSSSLNRIHKKRHTAKVAIAQLQALAAEGVDEELETLGAANGTSNISKIESPSSSPLLSMQSISGYNKRNRINSYDIDNIVIPYSVAASTRVEKLQYKEILTPKWRIAESDVVTKCDVKNNGIVRNPSQDSDVEDLTEEAVVTRHDKCEYEEKKKFLSYLKLPLGYGRSRSHKRTDSRAESSGANTPDPLSPHTGDNLENMPSPMTSPPATPMPVPPAEECTVPRRRTISQSRWSKDKELVKQDDLVCSAPEQVDVAPYDKRSFPLSEDTYDKMLKHMPENHQFTTNARSQDSRNHCASPESFLDEKPDSADSESTESALGDEDPNDPEWIEMERVRDRHKR